MPFDLEKAIAAWRRPYEVSPVFSDEDIEELESSLRDRIEALVAQGIPEQKAFYMARARAGSYGAAETEYRKVFWAKAKRQNRLTDELLWRIAMYKNYITIALRSLRKHKGYASINVVGLATGIAASVLVLLFVLHETSFDKHHENAANLYRVCIGSSPSFTTTYTAAPLARTLISEFPEVVNATRFYDGGRVLLEKDDRRFYETGFLWADSTVFDLFTIPLVAGDPATALTEPHTLVLTEEMARKYFGEADPIGKTLQLDNSAEYEVTGVIRPLEANSHLDFDFLASLNSLPHADSDIWVEIDYRTYVVLREGARPDDLLAKLPILYTKYVAPQILERGWSTDRVSSDFFLESVSEIYLHSDAGSQLGPTGDIQYVYLMSAIAFFILLIASINFMNLTTAASAQRAKEVGIRKVMGSGRSHLIAQFLGESVLMALLALVLAYGLVYLALPAFQRLTGVALSLSAGIAVGMIGIAVVTGLLAGLYPAFVLSGFSPTVVLKGALRGGASRSWLRSSLVVTQFAISIVLLVGTAVVYKQLAFIQNRDLGFDQEQVVVLSIETRGGAERFERFRSELLQHTSIVEVAASGVLPGPGRHGRRGFRREGDAEDLVVAETGEVSPEYAQTLGLEIVAGRFFSRDHAADMEGFVINEAAARRMDWDPQTAIGKILKYIPESDSPGPILGVLKDAHFGSLHETVQPLILRGQSADNVRYMPIRINDGQVRETMAYLEAQWASFEPEHLFSYFFLDEDYGRYYEQERRLGEIFGYFALLSIFIACIGLSGLASFVTQRRTKEIGVRKVLGSSVVGIVVLLSKEFTYLVVLAALIAFPVSYVGMRGWLENFAYATSIGWEVYVFSGVVALVIAWGTVGYHAIRAAIVNPVQALRYE